MITVSLSEYEWDHVVQSLSNRRDEYKRLADEMGQDTECGVQAFVRSKCEQVIIDRFVEAKKAAKNG